MNPRHIRLVTESFAKVEPIADKAAALFYQRLFETDPGLRKLFKGDMEEQGRKLMGMLASAVRLLDRPEKLVPVLENLGRRHAGYGVKDKDYDTVGAAFLWTLEQGLGSAFTAEVREAWAAIYSVIAKIMIKAGASIDAIAVKRGPDSAGSNVNTKGTTMSLANLKVGTRLGLSFGVVVVLLLAVIGTGLSSMSRMGHDIDTVIDKDWVKADLANTINNGMRGNARRALELFVVTDRERAARIRERMAVVVKELDEAFAQLEPMLYKPEGKALFQKIKDGRQAFVVAFKKAVTQLDAGDRDGATKIMNGEALPALDAALASVTELVKFQGKLVEQSGAAAKADFTFGRNLMLLLGGVALLLGLALAYAITRSLVRQLGGEPGYAAEVAGQIAAGKLDITVEAKGDDGLLAAMKRMHRQLKDRIEAEAKISSEATRIKLALDNGAGATMIADTDGKIVYLNKAQVAMFERAAEDLRKLFPGFDPTQLVGKNIDMFHKNPAHQRQMLSALTKQARADIKMGPRTFAVDVSPVINEKGERLGTVAGWVDRTEELALQEEKERISAENLRVKNALDKCSTNVMIADAKNTIVYLNETLVAMMGNAESDIKKQLPQFDSRKLVGVNMDIFHKNPAHQQGMISNLRSTHRAQIEVGGRTFALVANPIVDEKGGRVGTVVEWKDRTAEVAVEKEVANIVGSAAQGDFTRRVAMEGKEGFFKLLAESINQLLETSSVGLNEVVRVLGALAKADLTEKITNDYKGTFGKLKDDSNQTVGQLTEIITRVKEATDAINTASKEIAQGNTDLSSRTEEQASSLEETASSMEELTSTVKQNAENAKQANQLAVGASDVAVRGGNVVKQVVETMNGISESSKKIADIIGVIDGIAFQTNILALNAAVEAARAGEQGRGFAVVATEVRNLAQRSAAAAKEIKTLIEDSVGKVSSGAKLVDEAGKTMDEIVTSVKRVTDIMSEITAASQEQSSGIDQVSQAVTQMDEVTQQNAALVEQAAAAAESLQEQAQSLAEAVSVFKLAQSASGGAAWDGKAERRGPERPANVARIPAKAPAQKAPAHKAPEHKAPEHKPAAAAPAPKRAKVAAAGGGAEDEWKEF